MLEMKVFRENSKVIFDDLKKRNIPDDGAKSVIQMDQKWRELIAVSYTHLRAHET